MQAPNALTKESKLISIKITHMKTLKNQLLTLTLAITLLTACQKELITPESINGTTAHTDPKWAPSTANRITEDFENATKGNYSTGVITTPEGNIQLEDALIGTLANDAKTGAKSVRIRNTGALTQLFDISDGLDSIYFDYAAYGTNGNSNIEIWISTDQGSTWTQEGPAITVSGNTLTTHSQHINTNAATRIEIRKTSGGSNRVNIDNLVLVAQSNPTGGGNPNNLNLAVSEDYESGSKGSYAQGTVTLTTGQWTFHDALLGSHANDRIVDNKGARIRNTGSITMNFDVDGAEEITIAHASYGSDGSATWALYSSTDQGATWQKQGCDQTPTSSIDTVRYTLDIPQSVRFRISKLSGGSNRINIDNFKIYNTPTSAGSNDSSSTNSTSSIHLDFCNPTYAGTTDLNNYLIIKDEYAHAHWDDYGTARWVSYHLEDDDIDTYTSTSNYFKVDPALPAAAYKPSHGDYTSSGYDRGHLCASADRTESVTANSNTYYITNIIPQDPENNNGPWKGLETYLRDLVQNDNKEVYVIAGGWGSKGTIASGNINVPAHVWKTALILDEGTNDLSRVNSATRIITVSIPNEATVKYTEWEDYRISTDSLESLTGYNFYNHLSTTLQQTLEPITDNVTIL